MFEKIISLESLRKANFYIYQLDDKEISYIKGENKSLTELKLHWSNNSRDYIFFNLKKKFLKLETLYLKPNGGGKKYDPIKIEIIEDDNLQQKYSNLSTLIIAQIKCDIEKNSVSLEIKEKENCKINKISIIWLKLDTIIYCCNYENLEKIKIEICQKIILNNYKQILPFFDDSNKVIFKSLKKFNFSYEYSNLNDDILKSIYNNINKMPNLKSLKLKFNLKTIEKEFYENFIRKIISLRLKKIKIYYRCDAINGFQYYLYNDLNKLKCDLNYDYDKIYIQKYDTDNFY